MTGASGCMVLDQACVPDLQALGWLTLFLPPHGLGRGEGSWNERIADWMLLWESDAHNKLWSSQWMLLFAQVAKHDTQGVHTITTATYCSICLLL